MTCKKQGTCSVDLERARFSTVRHTRFVIKLRRVYFKTGLEQTAWSSIVFTETVGSIAPGFAMTSRGHKSHPSCQSLNVAYQRQRRA